MHETRIYTAKVEIRSSDSEPKIVGHAAVFNALSCDLGGFREKVQPGAFARTLAESDVRALWNHNPDLVLGRRKAGTLVIAEDGHGLAIEITPPNTQWARDHMETMRRGDVDQMSFGFRVKSDSFEKSSEGVVRTLHDIELFEVSPVAFPAYPQTEIAVRAFRAWQHQSAESHECSDCEKILNTVRRVEDRISLLETHFSRL